VVYEDEHLLVLNKAAGMVVHPSPGHASGTLVNALLHRFQLPALRLDADGLIVASAQDDQSGGVAPALRHADASLHACMRAPLIQHKRRDLLLIT
jgi:23S rRNA-/tRNA-specific pseudouridylate synthase